MNPPEATIDPTGQPTPISEVRYKDVVTQILQVANQHKLSLALTALVNGIPLFIALISLFLVGSLSSKSGSAHAGAASQLSAGTIALLVIMILSFAVTPFWMILVGRIVRIEQILWVKAYFDNEPETGRQSLKKAVSLFWPSVRLSFESFKRYYWGFWLGVVLYVASLTYATIFTYQSIGPTESPNGLITLLLLSPIIILIVYFVVSQFVSIKTRYVQIIFVNTYGKPGFTYRQVFEESKTLTKLDSQHGKSFSKILLLAAGTDATVTSVSSVAMAPVGIATGAAVGLMSGSSGAGKAAGTLAMFYGAEATSLTESLAQIIIFYLYYLSAMSSSNNVEAVNS